MVHGVAPVIDVTHSICGARSRGLLTVPKACFSSLSGPFIQLPPFTFTEESCLRDALLSCTPLIQKCAKQKWLWEGHLIHSHILSHGLEPDLFLGTALVSMYVDCGCIAAARQVFCKLQERDLLIWNMLIFAYAKDDSAQEAFTLFDQMQESGVEPNEFTYVAMFTASASLSNLEKGQQLHSRIVNIGLEPNVFVCNSLMDAYITCGLMHDAVYVFNGMDKRDSVSWNTLIGGCIKQFLWERVFILYRQMVVEGTLPNEITFLSMMNASATMSDLEFGRQLHLAIITCNIQLSKALSNTLIDMYSKCGSMKYSWQAFEAMIVRDEVSWNAVIGGHARNGDAESVVLKFWRMKEESLCPNEVTWLIVLPIFSTLKNLKLVKELHACIGQSWLKADAFVCSRFVDTYAKCGELDDAKFLFKQSSNQNVVLWTVMIGAFGRHCNADEALWLFCQMERKGCNPNEVTLVNVLDACGISGSLKNSHLVHVYIVEKGFEEVPILENALVNLYCKFGCLRDACNLFYSIKRRDMVSYTSVIAGFSESELYEKALKVFDGMVQDGVKGDQVTFAAVYHACANIAALGKGRLIHFFMTFSKVPIDAIVVNALLDMYSKCGSLNDAQHVLHMHANKDIVSWNTMLSGCSQYANMTELPLLISQMEEEVTPNHLTLLSLLSVCGRSGMISEGACLLCYLHEHLISSITPEHYACMVDLLGRAGNMIDSLCFIRKLPLQPSATVWGGLLGACKLHGLMELAEYASQELFQLEPQNMAALVVLANMCATI